MVMRWTPATIQKEVRNMTYKELQTLIAGKDLPCGGTNDEGETVIIEHEKNDGDPRFHLTTVQNNGWLILFSNMIDNYRYCGIVLIGDGNERL